MRETSVRSIDVCRVLKEAVMLNRKIFPFRLWLLQHKSWYPLKVDDQATS